MNLYMIDMLDYASMKNGFKWFLERITYLATI